MNPKLDLVISRVINAPKDLVWLAWTDPQHLMKWWAPVPYSTPECEIDLRAGGIFRTVMQAPDGTLNAGTGIFLEVVEGHKIIFTDALEPGYRLAQDPFMTVIITFEEANGQTTYTATVMHKDEETCRQHEEMGFYSGWGTCIEQLAALAEGLKK